MDYGRTGLREGEGNSMKYLKRGWNGKEGRGNKDFKKGGNLGQGVGTLRREGLESPYKLYFRKCCVLNFTFSWGANPKFRFLKSTLNSSFRNGYHLIL